MCGRDSEDPLVRRLWKQDRLCLVRVPRSPDELKPGSVIVTYPDLRDREPVIHAFGDLFDPVPAIAIVGGAYQPMNIAERTSELSLDAVVQLAAAMGGDLAPGDLGAALKAARKSTLSLKLDGGARADLQVGPFERDLRRASLTDEGERIREEGARFHVVTRTVTAKQVQISGSEAFEAAVRAKVEALGSGKLSVAVKGSSSIVMARVSEPLVVGFQLLEIVVDAGMSLRGARGPIAVRGPDPWEALDPSEVAEEGSIFAAPSMTT